MSLNSYVKNYLSDIDEELYDNLLEVTSGSTALAGFHHNKETGEVNIGLQADGLLYMLHLSEKDSPIKNSVRKEMIEENISIYPNPTTDIVNVNGGFNKATIFDMQGKMQLSGKNGESIAVGHLNNGVYLIKIENENGVYTEKLIIRK